MSAIGIIGGTGVYDPSIFENIHEESLMTPYGEIDYVQGTYHGKQSSLLLVTAKITQFLHTKSIIVLIFGGSKN
ncbi:5'-methylthioadenosine phosphorylase [Veillonella sp. oral taxon 158 str. F0412]|nr:5'-methylthioadenosine phosphorylase [Veillonella sp. oral taxon 158 str. F0412]